MINYVLGFLFDREGELVWLIKKSRGPANLIGKYNGIGGKVESGETPEEAMHREGKEEAGVDALWVRYGSMGSAGLWTCDLFYADGTGLHPRSMDNSEPGGYDWSGPLVDNLPALLSLATLARDGRNKINVRLDFLTDGVSLVEPRP